MSSRVLTAPLSDFVTRVVGGGTPPRSVEANWEGTIPWVSVKDIVEGQTELSATQEHISEGGLYGSAAALIPAGTPIVCTRMAVGRSAIPTVDVAINQDLKALFPAHDVDGRYLLHSLTHLRPRLDAIATGSTVRGISVRELLAFELPKPDLGSQRRIVEGLDAIDQQIALTKRVIAKLDGLRRGQIADMLSTNDADSTVPLGKIAKVASGVTLGSEPSGPGTVRRPYLRVANVQDGHLDLAEIKFVRVRLSDLERFELSPGDVLMNEGGDADKLGRGTVWRGEIAGCLHQNHVFRVRCSLSVLDPDYLSIVTGSEIGKRYFMAASKQTTNLASINSTQIKAFPVPLRPLARQQQIVDALRATETLASKERAAAIKLKMLRSALSDDLLSGRVRVMGGDAA